MVFYYGTYMYNERFSKRLQIQHFERTLCICTRIHGDVPFETNSVEAAQTTGARSLGILCTSQTVRP